MKNSNVTFRIKTLSDRDNLVEILTKNLLSGSFKNYTNVRRLLFRKFYKNARNENFKSIIFNISSFLETSNEETNNKVICAIRDISKLKACGDTKDEVLTLIDSNYQDIKQAFKEQDGKLGSKLLKREYKYAKKLTSIILSESNCVVSSILLCVCFGIIDEKKVSQVLNTYMKNV